MTSIPDSILRSPCLLRRVVLCASRNSSREAFHVSVDFPFGLGKSDSEIFVFLFFLVDFSLVGAGCLIFQVGYNSYVGASLRHLMIDFSTDHLFDVWRFFWFVEFLWNLLSDFHLDILGNFLPPSLLFIAWHKRRVISNGKLMSELVYRIHLIVW